MKLSIILIPFSISLLISAIVMTLAEHVNVCVFSLSSDGGLFSSRSTPSSFCHRPLVGFTHKACQGQLSTLLKNMALKKEIKDDY